MRPFVKVVSRAICMTLASGLVASHAASQDPIAPAADLPPVAATVDGDPIFVVEMDSTIEQMQKDGRMPRGDINVVKAALLTQLVDRRLVVHQLARDESLIKAGEIEAQMALAEANAKKQEGKSLAEVMRQKGAAPETIRVEIIWRIAWERYLERHLADALEGFFNEHRQELDGTELRASQILLRADRFDEKPAQTEARAAKIRAEIEAGQIDFAAAARKYSIAPSREQGGDLGFLPRQGVMLEGFSAALFKLKKGEIGQPVTTPYGTHLITVTDIKPGTRQWTEVIPQIKPMAAAQVFSDMVKKELANAKVEYTGKSPYFKPGTQELVRGAVEER
jgi:parvulin-like peptidyl-prolyl isomerase